MGNTAEDYEQKARALIDDRMASVRSLANAAAEADRANAQLLEAWSHAEKAGWSTSELSAIGFTPPRGRRASRGRGTRARRARTTETATPPEHPSPAHD